MVMMCCGVFDDEECYHNTHLLRVSCARGIDCYIHLDESMTETTPREQRNRLGVQTNLSTCVQRR